MAKKGATGADDDVGPAPGEILLGKYRVESILGKGGMGIVVKAMHLGLGETVAIKMLRPDVVEDAEASARFLREAQAAVKLKSEHVARVTDVGTLPDGGPYMVMEFLEGVDLDQMIEASGVLSAPLAVDLVVQACEAIGEAHALGMVHRDIKPSNIFVTWRGDGSPLCKVLDFGISKAPATMEVSLTRTQSVLGTPAYMSPEQMRSARAVDARSDIWSIGTVLYELLCGYRPFEAESFSEMCVKVAVDPPTPFSVEVPAGLDAVIFRCLEKDANARFRDVAELVRALEPYARDPRGAAIIGDRVTRMLSRRAMTGDGSSPDALAGLPLSSASSLRANAIARAPSGAATPAPAWRTPTPSPATPAPRGASGATPAPGAWSTSQSLPPRRTTPWGAVSAPADSASTTPPPAEAAAMATVQMAPLVVDELLDEMTDVTPAPTMPPRAEPAAPVTIAETRGRSRVKVIAIAAAATIAAVIIVVAASSGGGSDGGGAAAASGSGGSGGSAGAIRPVASGSAAVIAPVASGSAAAIAPVAIGSAAASGTGTGTGSSAGSSVASGAGSASAMAASGSDVASGSDAGSSGSATADSTPTPTPTPPTPTPATPTAHSHGHGPSSHHGTAAAHAGAGSASAAPSTTTTTTQPPQQQPQHPTDSDDDIFGKRK